MIDLLIDVIKNDRKHPYYDRVCKLRKKYTRYITGEDMDEEMKQFNRRESIEEFNQRKSITKHITKTVCKNLMKPQFKIPRSNGTVRILNHADQDKEKELVAILNKFWGDKTLDEWMGQRWIELNNIDPNAFCVIEWGDFNPEKERAMPYPVEISSDEAIVFEYKNNILQYLITRVESKVDEKVLVRYTMYNKNQAVAFQEIDGQDILNSVPANEGEHFYMDVPYYRLGSKVYEIIAPKPYDLSAVPAFRIGYVRDLYTNGATFISPLDDAMPILEKMVKANSEFDLAMALHAFPQKIQYVRRCSNDLCNKGYVSEGERCPVCHGEGLEVATSTQEVIRLEMPRAAEDFIPLDNIVRYIANTPVDLLTFQKEYIIWLIEQCKAAIYNSEIFSRKEIAETATSKNIDLQNVYDTLYPMAQDYAREWQFIIEVVADITQLKEGLDCKMIFPKDFKMKSLSELYYDLKIVSDSRADPFLKQHIYDDIAMYIYQDDSYELKRYMTKREFYPFSGKSSEEIAVIVASDMTTRFNKVFWANEGVIYDRLERANIDFYDLPKKRQWELINKEVEDIMKNTDNVTPPAFPATKTDG